MSRPIARSRGAAAPVVALLGVLGLGLAMLVDRGALLVQQCVTGSVGGPVGQLGVGLALLRSDENCPSGLALGADGRHVLGVVVLVALAALLGHVAAATVAVGGLARVAAVLRAAARLVARALTGPVVDAAPAVVPPRALTPGAEPTLPRPGPGALAPWRRGPPVLLGA